MFIRLISCVHVDVVIETVRPIGCHLVNINFSEKVISHRQL